jgi:hypothetical protein
MGGQREAPAPILVTGHQPRFFLAPPLPDRVLWILGLQMACQEAILPAGLCPWISNLCAMAFQWAEQCSDEKKAAPWDSFFL